MNTDLVEYQIGKETTWGTSAAATAKLMGLDQNADMEPGDEFQPLSEQRGSMLDTFNAVATKRDGQIPISGVVTYEDLPYWLDMLFSAATPSGTDPYVRSYAAPLSAEPTPRSSTVYKGSGSNVYKLLGARTSGLTISGKTGEPLKFEAQLYGKEVIPGALAALSDRSVSFAQADHVALYIDAEDGTIGTTLIATTFFSFELAVNPNRAGKFGLGALTPKAIRESKFGGTLKLSLELDATSKALLDAMLSGSGPIKKQIRILAEMDASHSLQFDFSGFCPKAPILFGDEDKTASVDFEFQSIYNSAMGNWLLIESTNAVADLA